MLRIHLHNEDLFRGFEARGLGWVDDTLLSQHSGRRYLRYWKGSGT